MAAFKNHLLVVLGFTFAGMIGAAFGTHTAQAVVATLVEVVNPTSSPVPINSVNATDPGRIPYTSEVNDAPALGKGCPGASSCSWLFASPTAGHRVVVLNVVGKLLFQNAPTEIDIEIIGAGGALVSAFQAPTPTGSAANGTALSDFDAGVLVYVDPSMGSTEIQVSLIGGTFANSGTSGAITLTGYELDCTVAACAPIANQ